MTWRISSRAAGCSSCVPSFEISGAEGDQTRPGSEFLDVPNFRRDINSRTQLARVPQATSTRRRSAIEALVGGGCTSAETLTCLANAADELARGSCGRG